MANRIPLVVVPAELSIKELPAVDDLDLGNSSIRNVATANVGNINVSSLAVTTSANVVDLRIQSPSSCTSATIYNQTGETRLIFQDNAGSFWIEKDSSENLLFKPNGVTTVAFTATGNVGVGITTPTSRLHVNGTMTLEEVLEKANITSTAMGANSTIDVLDCAVHYYTANSTANTTLNIRGNSSVTLNSVMSVNQTLTIAFLITNGATASRVANVQLDAVNTAIRWSGGAAPTGSANSTEAYSFTIIKTGAAAQYTILGSKTQFA